MVKAGIAGIAEFTALMDKKNLFFFNVGLLI